MKLDHFLENDLNVEVLFHDHLVVVTGKHTVWAPRRRIYLADLSKLPWLLPPKETWTHGFVADAFRNAPAQYVESQFDDLRVAACHAFSLAGLVHYSVAEFGCIASFGNQSPEGMPVDIPVSTWPVVVVTLKERTLSPVVERFIECSREVAKSLAGRIGAPTG
jgi:DNA-binding transcriptional LysR family regulator